MSSVRCLLEMLKWVDYSDLCLHTVQVNRQWLQASMSNEVWDVLCEAYNFTSVHYEVNSKVSFFQQYRQSAVFMIKKGCLRRYDVLTEQWGPVVPVTMEVPFDDLSCLVLYPPYVIATGTCNPVTGQSALIDYTTGAVTRLPSMLHPRYRHGALLYKATVYVFAGSTENATNSNTAEKLDLHRRGNWTKLPNLMSELCFSSPCRKGIFAYIFGGWGTNTCHQFNLETEVFTLLPFTTPMEGFLTTAFVCEDDIYFCQSGHMGRWQGVIGADLVVMKFNEATNSNW